MGCVMVRVAFVLAMALTVTACGGGGADLSLQSDLEAEREARLAAEAELRRREGIAELNAERERLRKEKAEADVARLNAEAKRQAAEQARKEREAEAARQARIESIRREREEAAKPKTYLPWPDHSPPVHTDLGPWKDPSQGLSMVIGHTAFGVRRGTDGFTPWIHGRIPDTSLYANSEVRRVYDEHGYWTHSFSTVRWTGSLVGYTTDSRTVTGRVTLGDFDFSGRNYQEVWDPGKSRLEFTGLRYEDGGTWGDGDLLYYVKIGKTFHGGNPCTTAASSTRTGVSTAQGIPRVAVTTRCPWRPVVRDSATRPGRGSVLTRAWSGGCCLDPSTKPWPGLSSVTT